MTRSLPLRRHRVPRCGAVHGFGSFARARMLFVKLGYYIGVGGTITYDRAQKTRRAIAQLPLSALIAETDCPDMPLSGFFRTGGARTFEVLFTAQSLRKRLLLRFIATAVHFFCNHLIKIPESIFPRFCPVKACILCQIT